MSRSLADPVLSPPSPAPARSRRPELLWAALVARLVLAAVFGYAALSKIADPAGTVRSVRAYDLLPDSLATLVGHALPSLELALAVLLLGGIAVRLTASVAAGLLAVFVAGISSAAARGLRIDCGCFGVGGATADPHYAGEIVRDAVLLAVAVLLALAGRSALQLPIVGAAPVAPEVPASRGRGRAEWMRYESARVRHHRRSRAVSAVAAAVLAVSALLGAAVGRASEPPAPQATPAGATSAGGLLVGSASAPHTVVLYEDPQCPVCGEFERTGGPALAAAVRAGRVRVDYRMRSFLGPESVRAVAALGAAADAGKFEQLREQMFADQPAEHSGGYSVDDLLTRGRQVGLGDDRFEKAVRSQTYAPWARSVDDRASRDGHTGTPEMLLDGTSLAQSALFDAQQLAALLA